VNSKCCRSYMFLGLSILWWVIIDSSVESLFEVIAHVHA
jgi:hypothetical protein